MSTIAKFRTVEYKECPISIRLSDSMISLTDMWKAQGSPGNRNPSQWLRLPDTEKLILVLTKENVGRSHIIKTQRGKGGGTFAVKALAEEYQRYLTRASQSNLTEKQVQKLLYERTKPCEREVVTPVGSIDILSSKEIIEVKPCKYWKSAIGQVLVYGLYYPSHSKRIHLFGVSHSGFKEIVESAAKKLGVIVTWESSE